MAGSLGVLAPRSHFSCPRQKQQKTTNDKRQTTTNHNQPQPPQPPHSVAILAQVKLPGGRFTWDEAKATIARAHSSLSGAQEFVGGVFRDGVLEHPLFV